LTSRRIPSKVLLHELRFVLYKHYSEWRQIWTYLKVIRNDKHSVLKLYSLLILRTQKTQTSKYTVYHALRLM